MNKLILTTVAACVSMAMTAAYAETTTKQDQMRVAQADTAKPAKKSGASDPAGVSDSNTTQGPSGTKGRTPSGKQRGTGPDAKGVDEANTTQGPSGTKGRTPSGKQRKSGPDAKGVDDSPSGTGAAKKAEKK